MFSSKKKRQKQRDPPDAALLSSLSVLYAFIDEHRVPWLYRDCADDKGKTKIIKALAKGTLADDIEQRKIVLEAKACAMASNPLDWVQRAVVHKENMFQQCISMRRYY